MMTDFVRFTIAFVSAAALLPAAAYAQSVGLPAPRLLTTWPMGGRAGTTVEIAITGDNLDDADQLLFSDARLVAARKLAANGQPEPNKYTVTIDPACPAGVYETRVLTRLGLSSSRIFSVGTLDEVHQKSPNTTLAAPQELPLNSVCNAATSVRAVDYYAFTAKQGQRVIVDCATRGIDSKLDAVVIVADSAGRDLLVERRGGVLDFNVPADGRYVIKVHELTFKGGPEFFYRLGLWEQPAGTPIVRQPSTHTVNSFSWPPTGLREQAELTEVEPNNDAARSQRIALPCDLAGTFFPAADVDRFEFEAKKGEEWWIEIGSERFGHPTDPAALVQHVARTAEGEKLTDVAEFADIPSPVKVSSNGYAYDGPPYDAGTADVLGKLVVKEDGVHRLQITDLFGGTRNDARNVYRLVIRKAQPDFALVAWALHMELRNGDRAALSKPIALRGGATIALEVVALRRDGYDGDIDLVMENLPEGVTASSLKIASGQSRGMLLVTADQNAPRAWAQANFYGRAQINGAAVTRPCRLASMTWPIADAWGEVPTPRLLADVPVSVSGYEFAPLTIAPSLANVFEAKAGEKLTIPLVHTRRSEFSGATLQLRTLGAGFERVPQFDVSVNADTSQAVIDLGVLKTPPGEYQFAFYGGAVAKYRHHVHLIAAAEEAARKAEQDAKAADAEAMQIAADLQAAADEAKEKLKPASEAAVARQKAAAVAVAAANERLKQVTAAAQPKDIVDIVVSQPITLRIQPAETK
jgi:hypothetical protein